MKALVVADSKLAIDNISQVLEIAGYDVIVYKWLIKALDNIEEICPHLIVVSTKDYPRHWKTLTQFASTEFGGYKPQIILYADGGLSDDDIQKARALDVRGFFTSVDVSGLDQLREVLTKETDIYSGKLMDEDGNKVKIEISVNSSDEDKAEDDIFTVESLLNNEPDGEDLSSEDLGASSFDDEAETSVSDNFQIKEADETSESVYESGEVSESEEESEPVFGIDEPLETETETEAVFEAEDTSESEAESEPVFEIDEPLEIETESEAVFEAEDTSESEAEPETVLDLHLSPVNDEESVQEDIQPQLITCSLVFSNPISGALVTGYADNFDGSTLNFRSDVSSFTNDLYEGLSIPCATLKTGSDFHSVSATVKSNKDILVLELN